MSVVKGGQRHILAVFFVLAMSFASVRAIDSDAIVDAPNGNEPIDGTSHEEQPKQTCATFYRLDDVTQMNDEIRRCLIPSRPDVHG